MQTTLRLDDQLYRQAKAEAARQGITMTRFLEEGLLLRLKKNPLKETKPHLFPVYDPGRSFRMGVEEIKRVDNEEQEQFYLKKVQVERTAK